MSPFAGSLTRGLSLLALTVCLSACGGPSAGGGAVPAPRAEPAAGAPPALQATATQSEEPSAQGDVDAGVGSGAVDELARFPLFVTPATLGLGIEAEECATGHDPFSACI